MADRSYNPNDPGFLASRDVDGDLSPVERARLECAIARSPALREEAARLRAVDRAVQEWANQPVEVDWEHHAANVLARLEREETPTERAALDGLFARWKGQPFDLDEEAFVAAVEARLAGSAGSRSRRGWIWRFGVPLAAAAAVAIALTARIWNAPINRPMVVVRFAAANPEGAGAGSNSARTVSIVSYARAVVDRSAVEDDQRGISIGSLGAVSPNRVFAEGPPI